LQETGASVRKQLETALGKLVKADSPDDESDRIATGLELDLLSGLSAVHPWIEDVASDRAQDELVSLGISEQSDFFDHANTRAADYAKDRSAELIKDIDESTRNMLRSKIAAGLAAGDMREDIIDSIMDSDIFSEKRATLIADTEVAMANGQGALAGYKEAKAAGVKLKKQWICTDDPCDECQENEDIGDIDVEDSFPSGDDAEVCHPSCRCHTESVVEDDDKENDDDES
jgi:Phage Mu protein F like protein